MMTISRRAWWRATQSHQFLGHPALLLEVGEFKGQFNSRRAGRWIARQGGDDECEGCDWI